MSYSVREALDLMDSGLMSLPAEEVVRMFSVFFEPGKLEGITMLSVSKDDLIGKILERADKKPEVKIPVPVKINLELLKELEGGNGSKNAGRVITSIKKFKYRTQEDRDLEIFEQMPTEEEALRLYQAAMDFTNSGKINKPWKYQGRLGECSFRLLESYLRKRELVH